MQKPGLFCLSRYTHLRRVNPDIGGIVIFIYIVIHIVIVIAAEALQKPGLFCFSRCRCTHLHCTLAAILSVVIVVVIVIGA